MTETIINLHKHIRIEFGTYSKTHESLKPTKYMQSKTNTCIYLRPTGNIQG